MLNEYHLEFLRRFNDRTVRYLVLGGQARAVHFGIATRDLDIWVDIGKNNGQALEDCLVSWSANHPLHVFPPLTSPLNLRPNVQIKIPDADVYYLNKAGNSVRITPDEGIDILTSVDDRNFEEYYNRSVVLKVVGDLDIRFIAPGDVDELSTLRKT